ncbi:MAG: class I SAM-dependent rRNA methyltransferase [Armatimonadota bacterium]|nr:class I SAM-dependent rRNA methyltransferase [Armatimonadota bacterium]MDR7401705.1 class I SAM-dependent rRNA methyltransferase [Armatimonadota bacterium]MDR7404150.1 class I SAM-dependent rRNA methyltransferase [Armatimonadota bacterium]MDR7436285.1 class I SAM-dependent rRNA methyltransferase [Armatimonadota bacterium]MDR7471335.1 class I SAM-dependent rRNA methyltransferase [Armatimonadota bacterium]
MATVVLKPGRDQRLRGGYLWIFAGEIARIEGDVQVGDVVDVRSARGQWVGRGLVNPQSALTVRLLTVQREEIDREFFRRRIQEALDYRARWAASWQAVRVVYGEADRLPGLIVDRYGDVVVVQTVTAGMDLRREMLAEVLEEVLQPAAIYERNDAPVRRLEGLPERAGWLRGERPPLVEVAEGPARWAVDVARGQKTGFYLDQRENRLAVAARCRGAEVLDVFCYTGAFAIQAALAGAARVVGVDISADALAHARRHAEMNGVAGLCTFSEANAFDELRRLAAAGARFDVVILDPPPFARSRDAVERALAGYKEINLRAMKLLRPGGLLVTCSCSHHVGEDLLLSVVADAAADARRAVRLVESRGQAADHPVHPAMLETGYLTCLLVEVRPR